MNAGVAYLIRRSPEARGVLDEVTETYRKVYVTEKDVSMTEKYQAGASGLAPEIRLKLSQRFEWKGEDLILYKGTRWKILRPYSEEKADGAELTLERERGNAAEPAQEETETVQGDPAATGGSEGSGAPVGQSPEGDSDPNESTETSGANANSGATATIEGAETTENEPAPAGTEGGENP